MNFSDALNEIKAGKRMARAGWNGKGMFIRLEKGSFDGPARGFRALEEIPYPHPSTQDGISFGLFLNFPEGYPVMLPHIVMMTASGATLHGWLASQTDMLAEDWTEAA